MGTSKKDPREMENSPFKKRAEKIAQEWYEGLDLQLADINIGKVLQYWLVYRIIGIYEHGK